VTDIAAVVQGFDNVRPTPGLDDSWTWSLGPFTYALALTADGAHAVQLNARGEYDEELVAAVLSVARRRTTEVLSAAPFAVLDGFAPPASSKTPFDTVAAAIPAVHRYNETKEPELHEVTYAVFPAYRCEFSGRETQKEAVTRFNRMLNVVDLGRLPTPWLRMRFQNPKTRSGNVTEEFGLVRPEVLFAQLRKMDGVDEAYVEFENFQNRRARASWSDGLQLSVGGGGGGDARPVEMAELIEWTHTFAYEGIDDES